MNIFIKSCNRPHYLDKCISSINKHVLGVKRIVVIDDGTPEKFLNEIRVRHPEVIINLTESYLEKSFKNERAEYMSSSIIPWPEWRDAVERILEDFFILLEDDQWFTQDIDVHSCIKQMSEENVLMLRLIQTQLKAFNEGDIIISFPSMVVFKPWFLQRSLKSELFRLLAQNQFRGMHLLGKIRTPVDQWWLNAYSVYAVCGAVYSREYWLEVTSKSLTIVDEGSQIKKALKFLRRRANANFSYATTDVVKTSFRSSVSAKHLDDLTGFNTPKFNRLMSNEWVQGRFDHVMNNGSDFPISLVDEILEHSGEEELNSTRWKKWSALFSGPYVRIGMAIS